MKKNVLIFSMAVVVGGAIWLWMRTPRDEKAEPGTPTSARKVGSTLTATSHETGSAPAAVVPVHPSESPVKTATGQSSMANAAPKSSKTTETRSSGGTGQDPLFIAMAERPWHPGEDAMASITTADGHTVTGLHPNQVNTFPQVNIQQHETVSVTVAWPQGSAGEKVVAVVEDGGYLGDKQRILKMVLDEKREMNFTFTSSEARGVSRVTLRKGGENKTVQFWAGAELELVEAN